MRGLLAKNAGRNAFKLRNSLQYHLKELDARKVVFAARLGV